jgi:hypothetical protein
LRAEGEAIQPVNRSAAGLLHFVRNDGEGGKSPVSKKNKIPNRCVIASQRQSNPGCTRRPALELPPGAPTAVVTLHFVDNSTGGCNHRPGSGADGRPDRATDERSAGCSDERSGRLLLC